MATVRPIRIVVNGVEVELPNIFTDALNIFTDALTGTAMFYSAPQPEMRWTETVIDLKKQPDESWR